MYILFPSLSVVTASSDGAAGCWPVPGLWFVVGWGGLGTAGGRLQPCSRPGPGAAHTQGSWTGLRGAPSQGLVVGAGAGLWSAAAGGAHAVSFTSTG